MPLLVIVVHSNCHVLVLLLLFCVVCLLYVVGIVIVVVIVCCSEGSPLEAPSNHEKHIKKGGDIALKAPQQQQPATQDSLNQHSKTKLTVPTHYTLNTEGVPLRVQHKSSTRAATDKLIQKQHQNYSL